MKKLLAILVACSTLLPVSFAAVGEKADFSSLDRTSFYQNKIASSDLRGKVVFIEYWGMHCPPCRAAMPKLQELYAKYKSQGFVLIASHCQMSTPEQINAYFKENKFTFPSCNQFRLPQGQPQGGIPFSVLVGADGKVVAMGYPSEVEAKVEEEMKKVAGGLPILSDIELDKYSKMRNTILEGASNIEAKIDALRQKEDDEEARLICQTYDAWLERRKTAIAGCRQQDALAFVSQANTLKKSVPSVKDFDDALAELAADPSYGTLSDVRKKEAAMRKKLENGKKVSPRAVENLLSLLSELPDSDPGIAGSAEKLKNSLVELAEQTKASNGRKAPKKDKKKRASKRNSYSSFR